MNTEKYYNSAERFGSKILHRYTEVIDGIPVKKKEVIEYTPTIYIESDPSDQTHVSIDGKPLAALAPMDSMKHCNEYARELQNSMVSVYGNSRYQYAFLDDMYPGGNGIEADISTAEVFTIDIETECEFGFPNPIQAPEPVNAITIYSRQRGVYYVLSTLDYTPHLENVKFSRCTSEFDLLSKFVGIMREIQPEIITGWNVEFFDITYLVNRCKKILGDKVTKTISPFGIISERNVEMFGKPQQTFDIAGIQILDFLQLYKKFTYGLKESYKLDFIAEYELGEKKVDYSEYGTSLHHLYKANTQKFIEYNIHDVTLVKKMDEKLLFVDLAMLIAYRAKVNYSDVFAQVAMWDALTVNYLKNTKKVIVDFFKESGHKQEKFTGAYVRDPIRGLYRWVVSFDLNSLYPSIIMGLNISPEKLFNKVPWLNIDDFVVNKLYQSKIKETALKTGCCIAANGAYFKNDGPGFLPEILDLMYSERKAQKKIMLQAKGMAEKAKGFLKNASSDTTFYKDHMISGLNVLSISDLENATKVQLEQVISACKKLEVVYDARQMATKINLNSCFGVLGNPHFRWYDVNQAEAITVTGQLCIKWISARLNEYLSKILGENYNFAVYGDTDSCYIDFSPIVQKYWPDKTDDEVVEALDKLCQSKVEPFIEEKYIELEGLLNQAQHRLVMGREAIGPAAFFMKKRYIMHVFDSEGVRYASPKMKIMGLESVRSTTPKFFRGHLEESYKLMLTKFNESQIQEYVSMVRSDFEKLEVEQYSRPTGVQGINERGGDLSLKGIPAHVRAAMIYNKLVDEKGLQGDLPKLQDGDKMKFLYIKEPNPAQSHVIGFIDILPKEFNLHEYVDKQKMFDDNFMQPITRCLETFGWSAEPRVDLMQFLSDDDYEPKQPMVVEKPVKLKRENNSVGLDSFFED